MQRARGERLSCLAIFIENWTIIKSDGHWWAAIHVPAPLGPEGSHAGNEAVVCARLFWGPRLFQEASARPAHQHCCRWTLSGSTWLMELMCLGSKELWRKTTLVFFGFFFLSSCCCSSLCIEWRHLCFLNRKWMWGKVHHLEGSAGERWAAYTGHLRSSTKQPFGTELGCSSPFKTISCASLSLEIIGFVPVIKIMIQKMISAEKMADSLAWRTRSPQFPFSNEKFMLWHGLVKTVCLINNNKVLEYDP